MTDQKNSSERSTLADVARAAGVSPAAASLAIRGKPGVGAETRRRVKQIADDLGYASKPVLAEVDGPTVGLVVKSRPGEEETTNSFYGPVIARITEEAHRLGVDIRLASLLVDEHFQPLAEPALADDDSVDGLLVLGAYLTERSADQLTAKPIVLVDGYCAQPDRFVSLVTDNRRGMRNATAHVLDHGHERVLLVGANRYPSIAERRLGYLDALADAGLEPLVIDGDHDGNRSQAIEVVDRLEADRSITAVVGVNDAVAVSVHQELQNRRISVPDEVSVVGFDDIAMAAMLVPGLDTCAVDKGAMGRLSLQLLLYRIEHPHDAVHTTTLATSLRRRGSVGPARTA